ncbi:hypothetical protein B0A48_03483 [Cryoendolithus antarcticus]|uniref:Uncharacterized protein n=1 Tax=Cryoendolithus antarcticus TaxID=1507870 RepID=A0A1V8TK50_9PEZI|nr:hypothetical protein B0A48_03483 [Cryoendolithus antarcticus]
MATNPQTSSRLLNLAPELRNRIYNLIFTPATQRVELIQLRQCAPQKSILLACQMIYAEANAMYKASFRQYLSRTVFHAQYNQISSSDVQHVRSNACDEADLSCITKLVLHGHYKNENHTIYSPHYTIILTPLPGARWSIAVRPLGGSDWSTLQLLARKSGMCVLRISPQVLRTYSNLNDSIVEGLSLPPAKEPTLKAGLALW